MRLEARTMRASASAKAASQVEPRPRIQNRPPRSSPTRRRERGYSSATEIAPTAPQRRRASAMAAAAERGSRSNSRSIVQENGYRDAIRPAAKRVKLRKRPAVRSMQDREVLPRQEPGLGQEAQPRCERRLPDVVVRDLLVEIDHREAPTGPQSAGDPP